MTLQTIQCAGENQSPAPPGSAGLPAPSAVALREESWFRLDAQDGLVREKHLLSGDVNGGPPIQLGFYAVRQQAVPRKGAVLVCPGLNGLPRQVAGIDPPDFPDRPIGQRLAESGFDVMVLDYCPAAESTGRSAALAELAARFAGTPHSAAHAIAAIGTAWLGARPEAAAGGFSILGHSLGAFIGAIAAGLCQQARQAVLASGVIPLGWLRLNPQFASPIHHLPDTMADFEFGDFLAANPRCRVQIQFGTADQVFGPAVLSEGARLAALCLGPRAEIRNLPMGHGTDAAAAIAFLNEGALS